MIEFKPKEVEAYKKELKEAFPDRYPPTMGPIQIGKEYHNPSAEEETGKRKAYKGVAWIKYWHYLIGKTSNQLKCTFCGVDICVDVDAADALSYRMEHKDNISDAGDVQAIGGHLHLNDENKNDGYIIVPMCMACNAKASIESLIVQYANDYVEEIGATIEKE